MADMWVAMNVEEWINNSRLVVINGPIIPTHSYQSTYCNITGLIAPVVCYTDGKRSARLSSNE